MGLGSLRDFLKRHRRVGFDTSLFIYQLESHVDFGPVAHEAFEWLAKPANAGVTSTITMTELLVKPYQAGDLTRVNQYFALLSSFPNLAWVAPGLAIADSAARLRARYRLRTPDALQIATVLNENATGFLTNDADLRRVNEVEVGVLSAFTVAPRK